MAVYRVNKNRSYTVMANYHLRDKTLSLKAVGLLSKMLSFNDGWQFSTKGLSAICKEGPDAVLAALRELEDAGYLVRHQSRDEKGRMSSMVFEIYEKPQTGLPDTEKPHTEKPDTDNPFTGKPCTENPAQLNTNQVITNERNNSLRNYQSIAGWSSDKETKELKGSLETIRKTAAEMITGIDEKLKERLAVKEQEAPTPLRDAAIPVYREAAMYAFEAGELDAYRTSMQANMDCKEAIEQTINDYYGNNRLAAESAVKSILEKFSPERVAYVLAQTIQQKDHDGRISPDCKEWAKGMDGSPDHATQLIIDSVNPGLVSLFTEEFVRQTAISRTQEQAPAEQSKPAVPEKAPEAPAPKEPEQAVPVKHRLTPEEKRIKEAVMDTLKAQIAGRNDGMLSTYRSSNQSFKVMMEYKVRIEGNTVTRDGEPMFAIHRRHSAKKVQGCYRELTPMLEYIGKEKTQEAAREKPSIREQLRAAAKSQPERKTPVKQKSHDVGLE